MGILANPEVGGWLLYGWARAPYYITLFAFLSPYVISVAEVQAEQDEYGKAMLFGVRMEPSSIPVAITTLANLFSAITQPFLGSLADFSDYRKGLLCLFAYLGALSCLCTILFATEILEVAAVLILVGLYCYEASLTFVYAYLPEITENDKVDAVSGLGVVATNLAQVILVIPQVLLTFLMPDGWDIIVNCMIAGVWWAGFSAVSFQRLEPRSAAKTPPPGVPLWKASLVQLMGTLQNSDYAQIYIFLLSYMLVSDGMAALGGTFGAFLAAEIHMSPPHISILLLASQIMGIIGAIVFSYIAMKIHSAKMTMTVLLFAWAATCPMCFFLLVDETSVPWVWVMGLMLGAAMGAVIALSRSLYARMIPVGLEAEFFGLFNLSSKITAWIGLVIAALVNEMWRSYRYGIVLMGLFFLFSAVLLLFVNEPARGRGRIKDELEIITTTFHEWPSFSDLTRRSSSLGSRDESTGLSRKGSASYMMVDTRIRAETPSSEMGERMSVNSHRSASHTPRGSPPADALLRTGSQVSLCSNKSETMSLQSVSGGVTYSAFDTVTPLDSVRTRSLPRMTNIPIDESTDRDAFMLSGPLTPTTLVKPESPKSPTTPINLSAGAASVHRAQPVALDLNDELL